MQLILNKINTFFTAPLSPMPLGIYRILIASFTLLQATLWYPDWHAFFGEEGWIQWEISQALNESWRLHMSDVYSVLKNLGFSASVTVEVFFWLYVTSALGLFVGWYTRVWAILTWFLHYILLSTISTFVYGVDIFLHISMFYLMVMPSGKALSLDVKLGRLVSEPSWDVTLSIRVLQIHMCLAYLSAGFEKMLAADWWNGNVLWRSVVQPEFRQFDLTFLADYPLIVKILSWFTMIIETGYFIGMYIPKVRVFWLLGMISLHLGIGLFLGLWLFGLIMIIMSISAFGYFAWQDVKNFKQA
ncbi:MAG: HTTM domain-containing protein [Bacteroidota bacterium]